MNHRTGGTVSRDHLADNAVRFPAGYAKQMAQYLRPHLYGIRQHSKMLDACAGDGALGYAFRRSLKWSSPLLSVDLEFAEKDHGLDVFFLSPSRSSYDVIVSNPPWNLAEALPIYQHLLTLLDTEGVLFFIINNIFCYQGSDRAEGLKYQKFYFLPRWVFKPSGRPLLDCGVMVYHASGRMPEEAAALRPFIPLKKEDAERE